MGKITKKVKRNRIIQTHPEPIVNEDLDKYLAHPVVLKKFSIARKVLDGIDLNKIR